MVCSVLAHLEGFQPLVQKGLLRSSVLCGLSPPVSALSRSRNITYRSISSMPKTICGLTKYATDSGNAAGIPVFANDPSGLNRRKNSLSSSDSGG